MFTQDPRSAKVSKGFESRNLQGRVNSLRTSRTGRLKFKSWNSSSRVGSGSSGCCGLVSILGCRTLVWEMVVSLKCVLIALIELEGIDMVIKDLDLEPKDIIAEFYGPSRWKELSKKSGSKILPCGDGSYWKTFKPIASLITKGKLK
uniref:Uncharacterized protein n=1 Tax=Tanacetum cinerariifolium TaxID=118510 RepID=A0A699IM99_TANCI|nr:hypothetical protein [Tanacetum cinerariifolium]